MENEDFEESPSLVTIHKRERTDKFSSPVIKKRKFVMVQNEQISTVLSVESNDSPLPEDRKDVLKLVKILSVNFI